MGRLHYNPFCLSMHAINQCPSNGAEDKLRSFTSLLKYLQRQEGYGIKSNLLSTALKTSTLTNYVLLFHLCLQIFISYDLRIHLILSLIFIYPSGSSPNVSFSVKFFSWVSEADLVDICVLFHNALWKWQLKNLLHCLIIICFYFYTSQ